MRQPPFGYRSGQAFSKIARSGAPQLFRSMLKDKPALYFPVEVAHLPRAGVVAVAALLAYEHTPIRHDDLSKLDAAFFTMNGVISVAFFLFVASDLLIRK